MDPMSELPSGRLSWLLVYTKARAEAWTDINLRNQGFATLVPRVASRGGFAPLFPRYVFVGCDLASRAQSIRSTFGVMYVVQCGDKPARVSTDVITEIRGRMNANGVVRLEEQPVRDSLFQKHEKERIRALVKLAEAGYRVKSA